MPRTLFRTKAVKSRTLADPINTKEDKESNRKKLGDQFFKQFSVVSKVDAPELKDHTPSSRGLPKSTRDVANACTKWAVKGTVQSVTDMSNDLPLKQLDDETLYTTVLKTVASHVGQLEQENQALNEEELYNQVRKAFAFEPEHHEEMLERVSSDRSFKPVLKVNLLKATNLKGKDTDGLSDPYCTLRVVKAGEKYEHKSNADDPEKLVSNLVEQSLNPVWNQPFEIPLDAVQGSKLYIDCWDKDKGTGIAVNKIRSCGGFKRLFKEALQQVTSSENDDFLGAVSFDLDDIPASGVLLTKPVEKRSSRSHVSGDITVRLSYKSVDGPEGAQWMDVVKYSEMHSIFAEYEAHEDTVAAKGAAGDGDIPIVPWSAKFKPPSAFILSQYVIQTGITDLQKALAEWVSLEEFAQKQPLDLVTLLRALESIASNLDDSHKFTDEEEHAFVCSLENVKKLVWKTVIHFIDVFEASDDGVKSFEVALALLIRAYQMDPRNVSDDPIADLKDRLREDLTDAFSQRFHRHKESACEGDHYEGKDIVQIVKLTQDIQADFSNNWNFFREPLVSRFQGVDPYEIAVIVMDELTAQETKNVCEHYLAQGGSDLSILRVIFELYFALRALFLKGMSKYPKKSELAVRNFWAWFQPFIIHWIGLSKFHGQQWVDKAIEVDQGETVTSEVFYSSSVVDVFRVIAEIWEFWLKLDLPLDPKQPELWDTLVTCLGDAVCGCIGKYTKELTNDLKAKDFYRDQDGNFIASERLCIAFNNLYETKSQCQGVIDMMKVDQLHAIHEEHKIEGHSIKAIFDECLADIDAQMKLVSKTIANQLESHMKDMLLEIVYTSPQAQAEGPLEVDDIITVTDPLLDYLNLNLENFSLSLTSNAFKLVVGDIWEQVLDVVREVLVPLPSKHDPKPLTERQRDLIQGVYKEVYSFFYQDGDGLKAEQLNTERFLDVERVVAWTTRMSTEDLICQYYNEACRADTELRETRGILTFWVQQVPVSESESTLIINVLSGRDFPKMDTNGLADPYVVMNIMPGFGKENEKKTNVAKKTLNPDWNEKFEISLKDVPDNCVLTFAVKDYDRMTTDDIVGEVILCLCDVTSKAEVIEKPVLFGHEERGRSWEAYRLLDLRKKNDAEAKLFVEQRRRYMKATNG